MRHILPDNSAKTHPQKQKHSYWPYFHINLKCAALLISLSMNLTMNNPALAEPDTENTKEATKETPQEETNTSKAQQTSPSEKAIKEAHLNNQELIAQLNDSSDIHWLDADKEDFLGLLLEQTQLKPQGGVIFLHGENQHPDWPGALHTLRTTLPNHGWTTLSISLPYNKATQKSQSKENSNKDTPSPAPANTEADQAYTQTVLRRIDAAIKILSELGYLNVIIAGSDSGAYWTTKYLEQTGNSLAGIIVINFSAPSNLNQKKILSEEIIPFIKTVKIPMLEIFSIASKGPTGKNRKKAAAARNKIKSYKQLHLSNTHSLTTLDSELLTKRIRGWLKRYAEGMEVSKTTGR